jgi:hypothetical protein
MIENHTPLIWFMQSIQKPQVCAQKRHTKLYVHEFGFSTIQPTHIHERFLE